MKRLRTLAELEDQLRFYRQRHAAERAKAADPASSCGERDVAHSMAIYWRGSIAALEWALGIVAERNNKRTEP